MGLRQKASEHLVIEGGKESWFVAKFWEKCEVKTN